MSGYATAPTHAPTAARDVAEPANVPTGTREAFTRPRRDIRMSGYATAPTHAHTAARDVAEPANVHRGTGGAFTRLKRDIRMSGYASAPTHAHTAARDVAEPANVHRGASGEYTRPRRHIRMSGYAPSRASAHPRHSTRQNYSDAAQVGPHVLLRSGVDTEHQVGGAVPAELRRLGLGAGGEQLAQAGLVEEGRQARLETW